jgi:hypothetical protein
MISDRFLPALSRNRAPPPAPPPFRHRNKLSPKSKFAPLLLAALLCLWLHPASAQTLGGSCAGSPYNADQISVVQDNIAVCNTSSVWQSLLGAPAADPNYSIALGANSLYSVTSGTDNTALGYQAGYDLTSGAQNIIIGYYPTTGVGITTGANNILIGQNLQELTKTSSNQLDIGNLIFATGLASGSTMSTGNVGIGTTSPGAPLDVQMNSDVSSAKKTIFNLQNNYSGEGTSYQIAIGVTGFSGTSSPKGLSLVSGGSGATDLSFIDASGNQAANIAFATQVSIGHNIRVEEVASQTADIFDVLNSGGNQLLVVNATGNTLVPNGSVGIGTTSPTGILDVVGGTAAASTNATSITLTAQNGGTGSTNGGSILLNTGSASGTGTAGTVQISGAATGPAFMTTSDARIKTNITPLENGLAGIAALTGVTYTYRPPAEREIGKDLNLPVGKRQMGVIAQNVEQVFPEVVETMGPTRIKSVNYNMLMAPMIEAVKTLNRRIDALMAAVALLYAGLAVVFLMPMRHRRMS